MTPAAQQPNAATVQHTSHIIHFPVHHLSPLLRRRVMWGHPHTAQLLPLLRSPHHIRSAFSLAPAISVLPAKRPFRGSSKRETKSAGHTYQICEPTNGRTDRTEQRKKLCSRWMSPHYINLIELYLHYLI
jgi:hypothetical protein